MMHSNNEVYPWHKAKVLLIYSPTGQPIACSRHRTLPIKTVLISPPLGLLYLSTKLLSHGYEVNVVDFIDQPYSSGCLSSLLSDVDVIGVSVLSFNRKESESLIFDI